MEKKNVHVKVDGWMLDVIDRVSEDFGMNRSEMVRLMLRDKCEKLLGVGDMSRMVEILYKEVI